LADEGCGCGDGDEGFGHTRELLIVSDETAVLHDPGEGPLDHPPALDHRKAHLLGAALDHLQDDVGLVLGPGHEPTGVAAVDVRELNEREESPRALQDAFGSISILDVGPMHLDGEQSSIGVGQDVALAALDLLGRIEALRSPL
jgi:hypothetical protein